MKINEMGGTVERGIRAVLDKIRWPVTIVLLLMALLTNADVIGRFFFRQSIYGNIDIQELMMVLVVFLAAGYCTLEERQAKADVVISHLSKRTRAILGTITWFLSAAILGLMTWQIAIWGYGELVSPTGRGTITVAIPVAPFILVAATGTFLICLGSLVNFFHSLAGATRGG